MEAGRCSWGEAGGACFLLPFHCPELNHVVNFNSKGAGDCSPAGCQAWGSILAAVHLGTTLFLFPFSPAPPQRGSTFPPPLERQLFSGNSPPPPT